MLSAVAGKKTKTNLLIRLDDSPSATPQNIRKVPERESRTEHTDTFIQSTVILYFFAFYNSRLKRHQHASL